MSIRYKFILSLLLCSSICLGIYIWIAKSVFENDKLVSIFESANNSSSTVASSIKQILDGEIEFAKILMPGFDFRSGSLSAATNELFRRRTGIVFLGLYQTDQFIFQQSKKKNIQSSALISRLTDDKNSAFQMENQGVIYLVVPVEEIGGPGRKLVVGVDLRQQIELMNFSEKTGGSFLAIGDMSLAKEGDSVFRLTNSIAAAMPLDLNMSQKTMVSQIENRDFLMASTQVGRGKLHVITAYPKDLAFQGLGILYRKSLYFFGLIFFVVLITSVLMTNNYLRNLDRLTVATAEISKGIFDLKFGKYSKDEFGSLAKSFQHMSLEIKRLLIETSEKARMESELKTARTVQDNMFPANIYQSKGIEICGLYQPASECGGDWWYRFEHKSGVYVLICDATGHGAPAALMTAAAKAAVNLMSREPSLDILKLAEAFNYALFETAHGQLLMTGFILHFKTDGTIEFINASHEPPVVIANHEMNFLMEPLCPRFGEDPKSIYTAGHLNPHHDSLIVLYTDGITSQQNKAGKEFGEKRFFKNLKDLEIKTFEIKTLAPQIFNLVADHRGEVPQQDDLTMVAIRLS